MKVRWFITHKDSESYSDCCDRFCCNTNTLRMAISDGISQSIFSGEWAEILTENYANGCNVINSEEKTRLCKLWLERVQSHVEGMKRSGISTWRLERHLAAENGAGATICGIGFKNSSDWHGIVLGDSSLIEVEKGTDLYKVCIHSSNEDELFDNCPDYFDSFETKGGKGQIKHISGKISDRAFLLLVTDPFASFLSRNKENVSDYIAQILAVKDHNGYCQLVKEWRKNGMADDDSTLGIIEFDGSDIVTELYKDDLNILSEKEKDEPVRIKRIVDKFRGVKVENESVKQFIKKRGGQNKKNKKKYNKCRIPKKY